jgi:hypothetical protein
MKLTKPQRAWLDTVQVGWPLPDKHVSGASVSWITKRKLERAGYIMLYAHGTKRWYVRIR